ncbi:hypothetical protein FXO37_07948 [Capsicum annuum]|nr:hypothetical protein FXO37_07948 [Capsicum annuum]
MHVSLVMDKGKIVTMEGTKWNRRVNYRTLEELFKIAKETSETFTYDISVSVLEFYNEKIRDILAPPTTSKRKIRQLLKVDSCISATLRGRFTRICIQISIGTPVRTSVVGGQP